MRSILLWTLARRIAGSGRGLSGWWDRRRWWKQRRWRYQPAELRRATSANPLNSHHAELVGGESDNVSPAAQISYLVYQARGGCGWRDLQSAPVYHCAGDDFTFRSASWRSAPPTT